MELAVLAKAVPRSEAFRFDPEQLVVVREGVELVLNPFDQRALRVALELRRPGDHVTVVSLGPGPAGPLLREARGLGADRALHLCDRAFAGSDLLASSAVLASALRQIRPELVLAGARSTDGGSGLLGPEVAARLGVPVITLARAVRRLGERNALEVDVETATGYATVEVDLPALLTVGEKIARPLSVSPAQFARVGPKSVELIGPEGAGLSPAEIGSFGSPLTVGSARAAAPPRLGRILSTGAPAERVREALVALEPLLEPRPRFPPPLPWPPAPDPEREIVVLATGARGEIDPDVPGIVTQLRRALPAHTVSVAGYGPRPDDAEGQLVAAGALAGYLLEPGSERFDSSDVARGLSALLDQRPKIAAVVGVSSRFGREVAGQLTATRSLGAVADAIDVRDTPDAGLEWSKPSFGGATIVTVRCRSRPVVATVPPALPVPATEGRQAGKLTWVALPPPLPKGRVRWRAERVEPAEGPEIDAADVVVAVGAGIGGPEGIARLLPTVRRWGASLAASRRVVDAGWLPARRQVGLTGRSLAPRLAILLGVRGAVPHMVGWSRARAIVAVNRDPEAPVFRQADVGIVGMVEEIVPELDGSLATALGRPPSP